MSGITTVASDAISIIECSCGNFELHRNGRLFHVAANRDEAERAVALIERNAAEAPCTRCGATPETGQTEGCPECEGVLGPRAEDSQVGSDA